MTVTVYKKGHPALLYQDVTGSTIGALIPAEPCTVEIEPLGWRNRYRVRSDEATDPSNRGHITNSQIVHFPLAMGNRRR